MFYPPLTSLKSSSYGKSSNEFQLAHATSVYIVVLLLLFSAPFNSVLANDAQTNVPENATARSYGDGWTCNVGYRKSNGACAVIIVPEHAYPTYKSYGKGWACKRGYLENNEACNYIKIPANGYLDYGGTRVKCDRGYIKKNKLCKLIKIPDNAYLKESSYEQGWACKRGYLENNEACNYIKIPVNGYLDYNGTRVKCDRGYIKKNKLCKLIKIPDNAYLKESSYETGWTCKRGYEMVNMECNTLRVPENAHISFSGKVWECDKPYTKKQGKCILQMKYR